MQKPPRGIHRLLLFFKQDRVVVRAQSRSARGTPYTVGRGAAVYADRSRSDRKRALDVAIKLALGKVEKPSQ